MKTGIYKCFTEGSGFVYFQRWPVPQNNTVVFVKMLMGWEPEQFPKILLEKRISLSILYVWLIRDSGNALLFCDVYEYFTNILFAVNGCSTKFSLCVNQHLWNFKFQWLQTDKLFLTKPFKNIPFYLSQASSIFFTQIKGKGLCIFLDFSSRIFSSCSSSFIAILLGVITFCLYNSYKNCFTGLDQWSM